MRTKIIALLICATMVIGVLPVYAFAEDGLSEWTYNVLSEEEKTAEITGYNGTDTELLFPKEINGYTMVAIADNAFKGSSSRYKHFTSVMIPDSYERIGDNNFYYYQDLEDIELPDGLRYIGINSFVATKAYEENYWDCLNRNQIICF